MKIGICFGGYCPMHQGHLDVIMQAKKENDVCFVVVCGYNNEPRSWEINLNIDERYNLIKEFFWKDEQIYMTVDTFYKDDDNCYLCCKYYTSVIAKSMDDYNSIPEEKFVLKAYNTWMTGAR